MILMLSLSLFFFFQFSSHEGLVLLSNLALPEAVRCLILQALQSRVGVPLLVSFPDPTLPQPKQPGNGTAPLGYIILCIPWYIQFSHPLLHMCIRNACREFSRCTVQVDCAQGGSGLLTLWDISHVCNHILQSNPTQHGNMTCLSSPNFLHGEYYRAFCHSYWPSVWASRCCLISQKPALLQTTR